MLSRILRRRLLAAAVLTSMSFALAGCITGEGGTSLPNRAMQPLKRETVAQLEEKGMSQSSPMVVRLFKQESELEVWKPGKDGHYELFKVYPICRWSGELGPKIKEGDRQAPEGFYTIVPGLMNPRSSYYLAFNTGFPNAFDRAYGRTGGDLMVHGDCSSRGCYAMTDEQIGEIYALARESFAGGQRSFQVQAYPFRMTAENMAKHRNNPHYAFWRMLKDGNDHFLLSRQELKVDVCDKRYVFNATPVNGGRFDPKGACPAVEVPPELAQAVEQKRHDDDVKIATLITNGIKYAPIRTGTDGGMHPVFLANIRPAGDAAGGDVLRADPYKLPGTLPAAVSPPREPIIAVAANAPSATPAPAATPVRTTTSSGGLFARTTSDRDTTASTPAAPPPATTAAPLPPSRPAATYAVASTGGTRSAASGTSGCDRRGTAARAAPPGRTGADPDRGESACPAGDDDRVRQPGHARWRCPGADDRQLLALKTRRVLFSRDGLGVSG